MPSPRVPLVAESYSADERQALLLLLTPFVVMTIAVGMSQAFMQKDAAVLRAAPSLGPTNVVRAISPPEFELASAASVKALTPSGVFDVATEVMTSAPVEASRPRKTLEVSPTFARLEAFSSPLPLKVSTSPLRLEASLPAEVATRAATPELLSKCYAPRTTDAKPVRTAVGVVEPAEFGRQLARAARAQTLDLVVYTDKYRTISFPMGDVPPMYGVCTDVVIRAYRMLGIDLQVLVHRARIGTGDPSIDHRRTKTLGRFFAQNGVSIPATEFPEDYRPGDIVTYHQPLGRGSQLHIAVVSDVVAASGRPMIVHNRGWGPQLEDALFFNRITGHYRYSGPVLEQNASSPRTLPPGSHPARKPGAVLSAR
ncbi:MAG: DUF1287 domain-containing protein [Hyphomicrobium sp.]